jgi:hypothetical protein
MPIAISEPDPLGSVITRRDMRFHRPPFRDYRWLETSCFTWTIPEHGMRSHVRAGFRTNLGVVETLSFVYSAAGNGLTGVYGADGRAQARLPR